MQQTQLPIFDLFDLTELARRTGYSELTLVRIKTGVIAANKRFRRVCATTLGKSAEELFGDEAG